MKTKHVLLISLLATSEVFAQIESTGFSTVHPMNGLFKLFSGGMNATYQDEKIIGNVDISVNTFHYFMITGVRKNQNDSLKLSNQLHAFKNQFIGFEFFLINRAVLDFDTTSAKILNYLSSLQAAPLTLRVSKEILLSKKSGMIPNSFLPVYLLRFTNDGRVIPYNAERGKMNIGSSINSFITLLCAFTRLEVSGTGELIDKGKMYFEPTLGISAGSMNMMKYATNNTKNEILYSAECRLGFHSDTKSVSDYGFLIRYVFNEVDSPKLRAGIVLSASR